MPQYENEISTHPYEPIYLDAIRNRISHARMENLDSIAVQQEQAGNVHTALVMLSAANKIYEQRKARQSSMVKNTMNIPDKGAGEQNAILLAVSTAMLSEENKQNQALQEQVEKKIREEPALRFFSPEKADLISKTYTCATELDAANRSMEMIHINKYQPDILDICVKEMLESRRITSLVWHEIEMILDRNNASLNQDDELLRTIEHAKARIELADHVINNALEKYNQFVPNVFSTKMKKQMLSTDDNTTKTQVTPNTYKHFIVNDPSEAMGCIVFIHQGTKYVKSFTEPYPLVFPAKLAIEQMRNVIDHAYYSFETVPDEVVAQAHTMMRTAQMDLHAIDHDSFKDLIGYCRSEATKNDIIIAAANYDLGVAEMLAENLDVQMNGISDEQAESVTAAAQEAGLSRSQIKALSKHLGHVTKHVTQESEDIISTLYVASKAFNALIPDEAIERIKKSIDWTSNKD